MVNTSKVVYSRGQKEKWLFHTAHSQVLELHKNRNFQKERVFFVCLFAKKFLTFPGMLCEVCTYFSTTWQWLITALPEAEGKPKATRCLRGLSVVFGWGFQSTLMCRCVHCDTSAPLILNCHHVWSLECGNWCSEECIMHHLHPVCRDAAYHSGGLFRHAVERKAEKTEIWFNLLRLVTH